MIRTMRFHVTALLILGTAGVGFSQETPISAGGTLTDCTGYLVDSGLSASDYGPNENFTITVCPEAPETVTTLYFALAALGPGDVVTIYDGNSTSATVLGTFELYELQGDEVSASPGNTSGCLTVQFTSDASGAGSFGAEISCGYPCERPFAIVSSGEPVPHLACPGDEITFDASASTVASGFEIVSWDWDFDDGSSSTTGPVVTHTFPNPGAYKVQLVVGDNNFDEGPDGCRNLNLIDHLVLVSTEPDWTGSSLDATICSGQIYPLTGAVTGVTYDATPDANFGGALFIPDDQSQCFQTELTFMAFNPGAVVTNAAQDILDVFINFEHSFMGDLVITLICPDGSSMTLHQQSGGGTFLGEPVDIDAQPNDEGIGYDYYWSPTSTNGTWAENAGGTLPSGAYEATQPWNLMNGCPLNGTWQLEICDMWASDNGFIFDWTIDFNPELYPDPIVFTPVFGAACDSTFWSGPSIVTTTGDCDGIEIQPPVPGTETYIYTAINDFGCTFELPVDITVIQGPEIDISSDQVFCGAPVDLEATVTNPQPGYAYSYQWGPGGYIVGSSTGTSVTVDDVDALTNFTFTVDVSGAQIDNCSATATVFVDPLEPPLDFGPIDRLICLGEAVALVVGNQPQGLDEYTYVWTHTYVDNFGVTVTEQVGTNAALEATDAGVYNVVISMLSPCTWTAEGTFIVETELCELTIPNVFSPDNLGKNDAFIVDGLDAYPLSTMRIYNRWGALVFSSDDFGSTAGWNPTPEEASEGTYYFVLGINRTASDLNIVDETGAYVVDGEGMHYISGSFALVR